MNTYFDPNVYIKTVAIVGCGGTGAQVARIVGRILYDMRRARMHIPQVVLIDPDRFEEKNVARQLVSVADVGKYKVEVIGRRLNLALGLDVRWIPEPVDADRHFDRYSSTLVISCVDNHLARRELSRVNGLAISAGNHSSSGQICISNCHDRDLILRNLEPSDGRFHYLPSESLLFPHLLEPEIETQSEPQSTSCVDAVANGTQEVLVNDWVATVIGQYFYKLMYRQPISTFLTYLSTETFSLRSLSVCRDELLPYLSPDPSSLFTA